MMPKNYATPKHARSPSYRVRFAGGPLHNELVPLSELAPKLTVWAADSAQALEEGKRPEEIWRHSYQLVRLESRGGCKWLEYHHESQADMQ
jgi:hypothetical protein